MNNRIRFGVLLAAVVTVVLSCPLSTYAATGNMAVSSFVLTDGDSNPLVVVVECTNTGSENATIVSLLGFRSGSQVEALHPYDVLRPSLSVVYQLVDRRLAGGELYIRVDVEIGVGRYRESVAVQPAERGISGGSSSIAPSLVTATAGFIGVVFGVFITHILTRKRDRAQDRTNWRKMLYEQHSTAYIKFLGSLGDDFSPTLLRDRLSELRSLAPVSAEVLSAYRIANDVLSDGSSSKDAKIATLEHLNDVVKRDLENPA